MTIIRKTVELVDEKVANIPVDGSVSDAKVFSRAFAWGALEGVVSGLTIFGGIAALAIGANIVSNAIQSKKN